jgi:4-azaleucine resistance transporter AzlC
MRSLSGPPQPAPAIPVKPSPQFMSGVKASMVALPGIVSWGIISGVAMIGAGLTPLAGVAMSVIVYAGASQLAALQLISAGAPLPLVLLAGFVVNLRFVLFSLSLSPYLRHLPPLRRALYSYGVSDNGYALSINHFNQHPDDPERHRFFFGASALVWGAWQVGTVLGIVLGASIPASWSLEFTIILTFIALVMPHIRDRASIAAALTAGVVALATAGLPFRLGLIISAAAAIGAGMLVDRNKAKAGA